MAGQGDIMLMIILLVCIALALILWLRNRSMKKQLKELKKGRWPSSRWHKLLVALGFRKEYKPPHGEHKKGDVNIRVYRRCKKGKK
jgi:hypothetical protein